MSVGNIENREERSRARESTVKIKALGIVRDLVKSELEVADTFVLVAQTTAHRETARRNLRHAWVALKTARKFAEQVDMDSAERRAFLDSYGALVVRVTDLQLKLEDQAKQSSTREGDKCASGLSAGADRNSRPK